MHVRKRVSAALVFLLVLAALGTTAALFAFNNVATTRLSFTKGYRSITLNWTDVSSEAGTGTLYAVFRAKDASGTSANLIATLDTTKHSYTDVSLTPGTGYSYAVIYGQGSDGLTTIDTSTLSWSAVQQVSLIGGRDSEGMARISPHRGNAYNATDEKSACSGCHDVHDAAASASNLIITKQSSDELNARISICLECHSSTTSSEKNFVSNSLTQTSGHTIKNASNTNGLMECTTCHGVHQSSAGAKGALVSSVFKKFGTLTNNLGPFDATSSNVQCVACHDDNNTWYTAAGKSNYPSTSNPTVVTGDIEMNGYPSSGAYPGKTIAENETKNGHAKIASDGTYGQGDCRYCHSAHANGATDQIRSERGELRAMRATNGTISEEEYTSGDYASYCLSCHNGQNDGTAWAQAADIKSIVALPAGSTDASRTAFLASGAGHKITSAAADIPAGSALPCYTCHNPHGSSSNPFNLSDALGKNLTTDREVCFTCHTTSDGYVIDKTNGGYITLPNNAAEVVGLSRTGSDDINGTATANKLKLPDVTEAHAKAGDMPCSGCHKGVHAPDEAGGTGDADGKSCLQCHNANEFPEALKYEFIKGDSSEAEGWLTGYNPHLIPFFSQSMGESFFPEQILAPATQALRFSDVTDVTMKKESDTLTMEPLSTREKYQVATYAAGTGSDVSQNVGPYCAGCHAWHTAEVTGNNNAGQDLPGSVEPEPGKNTGATLRLNYNSTTTAMTDFVHDHNNPKIGGLCLSCHNEYLGDSSVGAPSSGPINALNKLDSESFDNCYHNYTIELTRKTAAGGKEYDVTKTFYANCAKCHNDADAISDPYTNRNTLDLKVHYVPGRRLLARIGIVADISNPAVGSTTEETNRLNYNNRGMCWGCHSRQGEIAGNAGKQYSGKDWYGQETMNSSPDATLQAQGWTQINGLAVHQFKNSSGTVIGSQTMNNEATFDDMYIMANQTNGYPSGDGEGSTADASAKSALASGREPSGHQPDVDRSEWIDAAGNPRKLKAYLVSNTRIQSIKCSSCHNTHATDAGTMGTHNEWPTTKKKLVGATGGMTGDAGTIYPDYVTPAAAIAADDSRLITLNDFHSRKSLVAGVKSAIVAWLQTSAGGSYSAAEAENVYNKMDYDGISEADVAATGNATLASEWGKSVDIFCFRCHDESGLDGKAHNPGAGSHRTKALACVECHIPTVHGGKVEGLTGDRDAIPGVDGRASGAVASGHTAMQEHQIFKWVNYSHQLTSSQSISSDNMNVPILHIKSITPNSYGNRNSCMSLKSGGGCHPSGKGGGSTTWSGAD